MQAITINIDDDKKIILQKKADKLGIGLEDYIKITIDDLIIETESDLDKISDYIINKNDVLYQRLAK